MEHKLISGGEQYLPFARSRIKAMRATGLEHAVQQFEVEGVKIRVRIVGEQEYIHIEGGEELFALDSGVVDIKAYTGPLRNYPGTLHETANVAAYNAPFVPYAGSTRWRKRTGDDGQISGHVAVSGAKFRGKVPYDGANAECVTGKYYEDTTEDPPVWKVDKDDDIVSDKKATMFGCPASIFTGRCRLYVQSLYGRPIYVPTEKDHGRPTTIEIGFPARYTTNAEAPPSLWLRPYRHDKNDLEEDTTEIAVTTSSGVYLDKATGEHWLMTIYGTAIHCYKLIPDVRIAGLKKYLKASNTTLDEIDKEHLEAYILATSLPSHKHFKHFYHSARTADGSSAILYSTAYGWHWNWSGTEAVIVTTRDVYHGSTLSGNPIYKQNSSQFSMSAQFDAEGPIGFDVSTVQDDMSWMLSRRFWLVVAPFWGIGGQKKLPPHTFTYEFVFSSVVFYAYYERDVLRTCSVSLEMGTTSETVIGSSAEMMSGDMWSGHQCVTRGDTLGWVEDLGTGSYLRVQFNIAGQETPWLYGGISRTFQRQEVANKQTGPWSVVSYTTPATDGIIDGVFYQGIHTPTHVRAWQSTQTYMSGTWDWIRATGIRTDYGTGVAIIPFDDAQAVYLKYTVYNEKSQTRWVDHITSIGMQTTYWGRTYVRELNIYGDGTTWGPTIYGPETVREFENGTYGSGGGWGGVPFITGVNRVSESGVSEYQFTLDSEVDRLYCNTGWYDVTINLDAVPSMFAVDMDYTNTAWGLKSGVAQTGQVLIVQPVDGLPDGISGAPAGLVHPTIVGWA